MEASWHCAVFLAVSLPQGPSSGWMWTLPLAAEGSRFPPRDLQQRSVVQALFRWKALGQWTGEPFFSSLLAGRGKGEVPKEDEGTER